MDFSNILNKIQNLTNHNTSTNNNSGCQACDHDKSTNLNTSKTDSLDFTKEELNEILRDKGLEVSKQDSVKELLVKFCIYIMIADALSGNQDNQAEAADAVNNLSEDKLNEVVRLS